VMNRLYCISSDLCRSDCYIRLQCGGKARLDLVWVVELGWLGARHVWRQYLDMQGKVWKLLGRAYF
jgi:hypothetical protein